MFRLLSSTLLLLCLAAPAHAATVKIGVINSLTGPEAPIGESLQNGIKLAEEDLRKKGVLVDLVVEDDTGKPQVAMSAMEKLATRDNVVGVVGPYTSSSANAVARLAQRYQVPLLVPAAAKEEITRQGHQWVYRLNAPSSVYASVVIDAALSYGKPTSIAFIYENTDFGSSTAKSAKEYAAQKGLKIVGEESYSQGSPDYRSTLSKIKTAHPDLVFMVSYVADAILLMRQSREMNLTPQAFLGGGAGFTTSQFIQDPAISNYVLSSSQWTPDVNWPGAKQWAKRYKEKFGKEPTYHAACGYEAMRIMGEAAAANPDRNKLKGGLKQGSWTGIMGPVKFLDEKGYTNQNNHPMLVQQVLKGKYETVFPPEYAAQKAIYPFPGWK